MRSKVSANCNGYPILVATSWAMSDQSIDRPTEQILYPSFSMVASGYGIAPPSSFRKACSPLV